LVFPSGIDAAANGDVYIVNSAAQSNALFRFTAGGAFVNSYPISQALDPSDIAIDEAHNLLYMADEFGAGILKYDISSGAPVYTGSLPLGNSSYNPLDVFVEPVSGRVFGTFSEFGTDANGFYDAYVGFEVAANGSGIVHLYAETAPLQNQNVRSIVAFAVPEPGGLSGIVALMLFVRIRIRIRNRQ
jgi:hypothetical protein